MGEPKVTKLVLNEEIPGWYFCWLDSALSVAEEIGLPRWESDSNNAVCLPLSMRSTYDKLCLDNGIKLVWKRD